MSYILREISAFFIYIFHFRYFCLFFRFYPRKDYYIKIPNIPFQINPIFHNFPWFPSNYPQFNLSFLSFSQISSDESSSITCTHLRDLGQSSIGRIRRRNGLSVRGYPVSQFWTHWVECLVKCSRLESARISHPMVWSSDDSTRKLFCFEGGVESIFWSDLKCYQLIRMAFWLSKSKFLFSFFA